MKTLKEWKAYYRNKFPSQSQKQIDQLAQFAFEKQQQAGTSADKLPTFGDQNEPLSDKTRGIAIGFGLTDANGDALIITPSRIPSYMQTLLLKNPKIYKRVQTAVYQASGRKYSTPDELGKWLQTVGTNLQSSVRQDPTLANVDLEKVVNAGIANRASNPIFAAKSGGGNVPTRQIYSKTKEEVESDINAQAEKVLGRTITPDDMQQKWYKDLRKGIRGLYDQGIVTEAQRVRNPKTGKIENVVRQVPQYSEEKIKETITTTLKEADPESLDRKQRLDFTKWFYGQGGQR